MKVTKDNRESYLKVVENNLRRRISSYPGIGEAEIESSIDLLHLTWHSERKKTFQHDKLSAFVLFYGLKRFHNPSVADIARTLQITKQRCQKGINETRKLLANHPKFRWIETIELGNSNLYRKGLSPPLLTEVKNKAREMNVDIRDEKVSIFDRIRTYIFNTPTKVAK